MYYSEHWLTDWERRKVIEGLLNFSLISYDNKRDLPLKSGGKTDIYIKVRDARNYSDALRFLSEIYANPLRRLGVERFIEVPDSVSCIAGPISISTGLPYTTIREQAKEGRVSKAKYIGNHRVGCFASILDDVITDGESKVIPYLEALRMGFQLAPIVVLVDRQQGWQENFQNKNINLGIWSGMTLHHVRKYLIEQSLMQRCDPGVEKKNPIILGLDGKNWGQILKVIDPLRTTGCILKVNDLLLWKGIERLIPDLHVYGRIMADIKGYDIESTLKNISNHFLHNPPWALTLHASGSGKMIKAVVDKMAGTSTKILAVTVLTSFDEDTCQEIYHRRPVEQVEHLAKIAYESGAHGFVCSPEEVSMLKNKYPQMLTVNPGVRSPGADMGSQKRVSTPAEAIERGADHIVMASQILGSQNPVEEVFRVMRDELRISL